MDIPLDPLLTPQQNAARYYKDYKKAQKAEEMLTLQLEKNRAELSYLDSVLQMISLSEGDRDLRPTPAPGRTRPPAWPPR